jgi:hypothetical protein
MRTESTEDGRVGIPEKTDSIDAREAAAAEAEASSAEIADGELPWSVVAAAWFVVAAAWGMGSANAKAAIPRRTMMLLENILTRGSLETEQT